MTTIIVDDEDVQWTWTPRDPNFVPPTIRESLERGFEPEARFYVAEGNPIAVWPDWDYAEDWSAYPIREVHPFYPILHGKKITEDEFRTLVKATHCVT
jgi:hypothetical protein